MKIAVAAVFAKDWIAARPSDRPRITRGELKHFLTSGVDILDVRIESLKAGPSAHELALAELAVELGLELRCHSWVGVRDPGGNSAATRKHGVEQGLRAARATERMGASSFAANPERDVWRGAGGGANPRGAEFIDGFCGSFHLNAPTAHLNHVGLADPAWHYGKRDSDGDGRIDSEVPREVRIRFREAFVMAYQDDLEALTAQLARAAAVWTDQAEHHIEPWLSTGRIDEKGRVVGSYDASRTIARRYGRACFYVGGGAMGQLLLGHARHAALIHLIRELKSGGVS